MTPSAPLTQRGHEEPFLTQFSIFLPNRVGQLSKLLEMLDEEDVSVAGISIVDATEWGVIRMIFTAPDKARVVLQRHGIAFTETALLAVVLEERDTFRRACKTLVGAELNVQFAYTLDIQREGRPVLVFHVEDNVLACQLLLKHAFVLLGHEDVM